MNFVHQVDGFDVLVTQAADHTGIGRALVEKDYWITHSLWALHERGLDVWFKGGTSLSKAFGIIERFSEDLDLMIEPGRVSGMPQVKSWTSTKDRAVSERRAFYRALPEVFAIPTLAVEQDHAREDRYARGSDYIAKYPGVFVADLPRSMSPSLRFEVGRARVVPYVECSITSFVHEQLERIGAMGDFIDNRPPAIKCVHPLVTLLEKLDAVAKRYSREPMEAERFVRHYEDAARIVRTLDRIPSIRVSVVELAKEMVDGKDIAAYPSASDPSLLLGDPDRRVVIERAYAGIEPMFWGPRIPLDDACRTIRDWVASSLG